MITSLDSSTPTRDARRRLFAGSLKSLGFGRVALAVSYDRLNQHAYYSQGSPQFVAQWGRGT
jgi:hypothetical protein